LRFVQVFKNLGFSKQFSSPGDHAGRLFLTSLLMTD